MKETAAPARPATWTDEEDAKFIEILHKVVIEEGGKLDDAYPIVSKELGRPEGGCKYRYTNTIKKTLTGALKEKLVDNGRGSKASVTQVRTRSNIITRLQQVDRELNKIDRDIEEAEKKAVALKEKKETLVEDMKRYTELLVKSATGQDG